MWIVRFLNGPLAGQIQPLTKASTLIGRANTCDIRIASVNISKEHTRLEIFDDKLIVSDAGSRNGTFVNGVQTRSSKVKSGDKLSAHDIVFEVQNVPEAWAARFAAGAGRPAGVAPNPRRQATQLGLADLNSEPVAPTPTDVIEPSLVGLPRMQAQVGAYMERVVLPGVYRLPQIVDFPVVLAGFMALFILLTTTFSTIPMVRILRSSIEAESQQHAMTIATTLARVNRPFLTGNQETQTSVDVATSRPGVKRAFILSNADGAIIAPAAQAQSIPDIPFVHEARKFNKEAVKQVDDNTVVAMYPIMIFNQDTGAQTVTHWAVVVYDMTSMAVNDGEVMSLFIVTLTFALALGFLLFYFLFKMIEHPIRDMNAQLDRALKDGGETVATSYRFPAMQTLASNVSSALTRALSVGGPSTGGAMEHDRNREISNLVELMGFAAMGIRAHDLSVAAVNGALEGRLNMPAADLTSRTLNELSDQALKLSVKDLITRVDQSPDELATNDLEFSGNKFQVVAQGIYGSNKIAYYLVVLLPTEEGG